MPPERHVERLETLIKASLLDLAMPNARKHSYQINFRLSGDRSVRGMTYDEREADLLAVIAPVDPAVHMSTSTWRLDLHGTKADMVADRLVAPLDLDIDSLHVTEFNGNGTVMGPGFFL